MHVYGLLQIPLQKNGLISEKTIEESTNIKYPQIVTNKQLMQITKQKPWSEIIAIHRLRWFGHVKRLPDDSPAKQVLEELERVVKRPRGRPATTWIGIVKKQI